MPKFATLSASTVWRPAQPARQRRHSAARRTGTSAGRPSCAASSATSGRRVRHAGHRRGSTTRCTPPGSTRAMVGRAAPSCTSRSTAAANPSPTICRMTVTPLAGAPISTLICAAQNTWSTTMASGCMSNAARHTARYSSSPPSAALPLAQAGSDTRADTGRRSMLTTSRPLRARSRPTADGADRVPGGRPRRSGTAPRGPAAAPREHRSEPRYSRSAPRRVSS